MSKALNSPTGRLLRNSRLFSLPAALPQPQVEAVTSAGILRSSDTATLPYPIRQAIAAPKSSRQRGDWGLKRALPQRSTRSSTPHLRVRAIDNDAHITDFDSAADHTQNLAKWQEMNITMRPHNVRTGISQSGIPSSVFDDVLDNTAFEARDVVNGDATEQSVNHMGPSAERAMRLRDTTTSRLRWKTSGPWVAGMSADAFQQYLVQVVKGKGNKQKFTELLRQVHRETRRREVIDAIRNNRGYDPENEEDRAQVDAAAQVEEADFEAYVKQLRDSHTSLSSELSRLIQVFHDLPPLAPSVQATADTGESAGAGDRARMAYYEKTFAVTKQEAAPPATHPSGGLSYLRTNAYMDNHPVHGPQAQHAPVPARVVRPRRLVQATGDFALVGVGGFVARDGQQDSYKQYPDPRSVSALTMNLDPEIEGGNKIWVHPDKAEMDGSGRVIIGYQRGDKSAIEVKTGVIDPSRHRAEAAAGVHNSQPERVPPPGSPGNANYGTALPDRRYSRARGFDDAARLARQQVERNGAEPGEVISGLLKTYQRD